MVPLTLTNAERWRRLPLTSTSTWSGDRPRSCAGRTPLVPSVTAGRGKFSEGKARASAVASSVVPVACRASGVMMSMGDWDSATVRSDTRVPVTITVSRVVALSGASWARARDGEAASAIKIAAARGEGLRFMATPKRTGFKDFKRRFAAPGPSASGLVAAHQDVDYSHMTSMSMSY